MAIHRTALGKALDMSALASRNERVRAVGNMKVNARGDTVDGQGKIVVPVTKKVGDKYQRSVTNRAANVMGRPSPQTPIEADTSIEEKFELTAEELEFEDTTEEDLEIERLKAAEAEMVIKPASEAPDFFEPEPTKAKKTK